MILICYYNYYFFGDNTTKIGFVILFKRLSIKKTIEEAINENKILKPDLKIRIKAFHKESREQCIKRRKSEQNNNDNNGEIISVEFSEWDKIDNGGGKFQREFDDTDEFIMKF